MIIVLNDYFVHSCQGLHLDTRSLPMRLLKHSLVSLSSTLQIKAKLLCSCLRLFDAIVELHIMDEKKFR